MSFTKMNIPQKICVGYQNRKDTYSGKLAYVIYYDHKGKLRKANSWGSWRDHKIEPDDYENKPTSGFVLNKKVGGTNWGWNPRLTWVRVYDPRGFEFEISVANLVFILEECSSIKGKGLEGEFVYAWDGKELILLPVSSQEYKSSKEFTSLKSMKIGRKDMVPGCWYKSKKDKQYMYLGREDYHEVQHDYSDYYNRRDYTRKYFVSKKKLHIFVSEEGKYWTQGGFTNLAQRVTTEVDPNFAETYLKYKHSIHGTACSRLAFSPNIDSYSYGIKYLKYNGEFFGFFKGHSYRDRNQFYTVKLEDGVVHVVPTEGQMPVGEDGSLFFENEYGDRHKL
jgi:hypothetical protein